MSMAINGSEQAYVLKYVMSPDNWWAPWGNEAAGVWHEVQRLTEVKLIAEIFHRLVDAAQVNVHGQCFFAGTDSCF
jgi:hypothetical protein